MAVKEIQHAIKLILEQEEDGLIRLKKIVRYADSDDTVKVVYDIIMNKCHDLQETPDQTTLLLSVVQYFVKRSSEFRKLVLKNISHSLVQWYLPIPRPRKLSSLNCSQILLLRLLTEWNCESYKAKYPEIELVVRSVQSAGYENMDTTEEEEKSAQDQLRQRKISRYRQCVSEFTALRVEIQTEMKAMQSCLDLLIPRFEALFNQLDSDDSETEGIEWEATLEDPNINVDQVSSYGLGSSSYQLEVEVKTDDLTEKTQDNAILFTQMQDSMRILAKRYIPLVQDWRQTVSMIDLRDIPTSREQHTILNQQLDQMQSEFERLQTQYNDLEQQK